MLYMILADTNDFENSMGGTVTDPVGYPIEARSATEAINRGIEFMVNTGNSYTMETHVLHNNEVTRWNNADYLGTFRRYNNFKACPLT
jgi:hypothetical protein